MVVGRLVSSWEGWEGNFSAAILNFGGGGGLHFLGVTFVCFPMYLLGCNILNSWLFPSTYCVLLYILLFLAVVPVVPLAFYCVGSFTLVRLPN